MKLDAKGLANHWVSLRPMTREDRETLRESGAIDSMWEWMPVLEGGTRFESYFERTMRARQAEEIIPMVVSRRGMDDFAGVAAFINPSRTHRHVRLGYVWHPERLRGKGIFRATQLAMLERAFEWGARRVEWQADMRNTAAIGAIESLGAQREGVLRQYQRLTDGRYSDVIMFSMLHTEWPGARVRLLDALGQLSVAE